MSPDQRRQTTQLMALLRSYRAPTRVDGMGIAGVGEMAVGRVIAFGVPNPHDLPTVCSYAVNRRFVYMSARWCREHCCHLFSGFSFFFLFMVSPLSCSTSEDSRSLMGGSDVVTSSRFHGGHFILLLGCWDSGWGMGYLDYLARSRGLCPVSLATAQTWAHQTTVHYSLLIRACTF